MRTEEQSACDKYLQSLFPEPQITLKAHQIAGELRVKGMSISSSEAAIVKYFIELHRCKKFIEIGTLTGYSGLHILSALQSGGKLWTFEKSAVHAEKARALFAEALIQSPENSTLIDDEFYQKLNGKSAEVVEGDAELTLPNIEKHGPFDGIFIDGNKAAYERYLQWAIKNLKSGGVVIADNVFLWGGVWGDESSGAGQSQVSAMKKMITTLLDKSLFNGAMIPTKEGLFVATKK